MVGFGAGIHSPEDIRALDEKDREHLYDLVYGEEGLRLNIIRIIVSPLAQPLAADAALRKQGLRYDWEHDDITCQLYRALRPAV